MTKDQLKKLEADLWTAADNLRANSDLKSSEYSIPVLGIIFLRFADNNYRRHEAAIHAEFAKLKGTRREKPISEIAIEQCGFYLPDHALRPPAESSRVQGHRQGPQGGRRDLSEAGPSGVERPDLRALCPPRARPERWSQRARPSRPGPRLTQPAFRTYLPGVETPAIKVLGQLRQTPWQRFARLQRTAARLARGRGQPKGVFKFASNEACDSWTANLNRTGK